MCHVPTVASFAIALLPAPVLAQVEPSSAPVPADDLTPYVGAYTIAAPLSEGTAPARPPIRAAR